MWILIQHWLAFLVFVGGLFELFSGVAFWEKIFYVKLSKGHKGIIARLIGLVLLISGGIWMLSLRSYIIEQGGILSVLILLSFSLLLLQSILVIIIGEKGMTNQVKELVGSFTDFFYVDEENNFDPPARTWGLFFLLISGFVLVCVFSIII